MIVIRNTDIYIYIEDEKKLKNRDDDKEKLKDRGDECKDRDDDDKKHG